MGLPLSGDEDEYLNRVEETRSGLLSLLAENGAQAEHIIPLISWTNSIDRRLTQGRLLLRELSAIGAIHDALGEQRNSSYANALSGVERFSLDLLERYQATEVLRSNWEARCAIGNVLTPALSLAKEANNGLIRSSMEQSANPEDWDLAQVIFDAMHHTGEIPQRARDFVLSTALFHENHQVRWNVVAALKSVPFSGADLKTILEVSASDNSSWVIRELLRIMLDEVSIGPHLLSRSSFQNLLNRLELDRSISSYLYHLLGSPDYPTSKGVYIQNDHQPTIDLMQTLLNANGELDRPDPLAKQILRDDIRRLQILKRQIKGAHGKTYKAAERVVRQRIMVSDQEAQETALLAYLASGHEALAWASVRELFAGNFVNHSTDFLKLALNRMLTHQSEWIRREAVEETLRTTNGRLRYIALREIELRSDSLDRNSEIRPYLAQIKGYNHGR